MGTQQPVILCSYGYDPLDRLISHTQLHLQRHQRFYCKSRLVTEIQGAIEHSILQHDNLLLAQQQRQEHAVATTLFATDQQRSVLHTLESSNQRHSIAYSPYGHRCAESGLLSLLGFNGERPDSVTGHYLLGNGYRAFNPVLMRFNSPDSWSPFGEGGLNCYSYCLGDPRNRSDQNGHSPTILDRLKNLADTLLTQFKSAPRITFKSGPQTTNEIITYRTLHTLKTENELHANGHWKEHTFETDNLIRSVHFNGGAVGVFPQGQPGRYYKNNPTLQELSYSNILGTDLRKLPALTRARIDPTIDTLNLTNASLKLFHQEIARSIPTAAYDKKSIELKNLIYGQAAKGEVMGFHPDYIKKIREDR